MKFVLSQLYGKIKFEFRITLNYLLFGILWILFSDKFLDWLVEDDSLLTQFQTYKGSFFIIVTSLFFYVLVKRHMNSLRNAESQRLLAEDELRKSEERLRDILFSTADWVWEIDENRLFTYSSIKGNELFEASQDDIIGKTPFHFMVIEEAERVGKIFNELFEKRLPIRNLENWNIAKNGKKICLLTNGTPIFDKNGDFKGYRGVDINITESKLAEETLKLRVTELNYSQEIAKMGSWNFNFKTNKFTCSRNMFLMLNISLAKKEIAYNDVMALIHPEDLSTVRNQIRYINIKDEKVTFYFRFILDEQRIVWVHNSIIPVFENNRLIELHGVNIDITDEKLAEQELLEAKERAEASDKLKTAFLNNISHEIRTPLNGILGFASMIIDPGCTDDEKAEYLEVLNSSSKRLMQTITDYMDSSLILSGNIKVRKSKFNLNEVLLEVEQEFQEPCKSKGLEFSIDNPFTRNGILLNTDRALFKKVISHLMDNALKFTKRGSILIRVILQDNSLEIAVKDTGIGINKNVLSTVFKHFMQEEIANTRGHEGSGLGLSIVEGLLTLLSGTIHAESVKGTGSTFTINIQAVSAINENAVNPDVVKSESWNSHPVILIAEDDENSYFYLNYMLKSSYKTLRAINGRDAIDQCKSNYEIKLVLMDIKMPGMNGLEATMEIKELRKNLPVIALTAYAETGMRDKCLDAGCDEYISKPVDRKLLFSVLSKFGFIARDKK